MSFAVRPQKVEWFRMMCPDPDAGPCNICGTEYVEAGWETDSKKPRYRCNGCMQKLLGEVHK